jgi:hypothetical protein
MIYQKWLSVPYAGPNHADGALRRLEQAMRAYDVVAIQHVWCQCRYDLQSDGDVWSCSARFTVRDKHACERSLRL